MSDLLYCVVAILCTVLVVWGLRDVADAIRGRKP
jgi:hypothetical protein